MSWAATFPILLGIGESLAAALIVAILVAFRDRLAEFLDQFVLLIRPLSSGGEGDALDYERLGNRLVRVLRRDQSLWGRHIGEFGKRLGGNSGSFQPKVFSRTRLKPKPRMYVTYWPTKVLASHDLELRRVSLALRSVDRLFVDGAIRTSSSLPGNLQAATAISFRHSMCGALMLSSIQGWGPTSKSVLGRVIEGCEAWQQADFGWAQDSDDLRSDLWSSVFAAQLLHIAAEDVSLPPQTRADARHHLEQTMSYFRSEWFNNKWKYHSLSSEENAVLILIELATVAHAVDRELLDSVVKHLKAFLNEWGQFTSSYLKTPGLLRDSLTIQVLYARFAYALFRAGEPPAFWRLVYIKAIGPINLPFNAADVSFLLDLTLYLKRWGHAGTAGVIFPDRADVVKSQTMKGPNLLSGDRPAARDNGAAAPDPDLWRCGIYDYPPLSEWQGNPDMQPSGPLVELAKLIAVALGKTLVFEKFDYDDFYRDDRRMPDMVMAMFATTMRSRRVIFSRAIYEIGLQGICRKEQSGEVLAGLREGNLRVAVYSGEVGWEFVKHELPDADMQHRVATLVGGRQMDTIVLLTQGVYDVVIMDELSCQNFLNKGDHADRYKLAFDRAPRMYEACVALRVEHKDQLELIDRTIVQARNSEQFLQLETAALAGYEKTIGRRGLRARSQANTASSRSE